MKPQRGVFGGHYNHKVIKELRSKLAQSNLICQALIEHTKIGENELKVIVSDYMTKQHQKLAQQAAQAQV